MTSVQWHIGDHP